MTMQTRRTSGLSMPIPKAVVATTAFMPGDEGVLDPGPLVGLEAGVVVLGAEAMAAQDARDLLGGATGPCVHDRRAAGAAGEALDEDLESVVRVRHLLHVVAEVRTYDACRDDVGLAAERLADLARGLRVAVAVIPRSGGSPRAARACRMKR